MAAEMSVEKKISMRHTKLKAEEVALIAGELTKPSWESRNEGIHERVSFEDTLWGFDLAGGVYYQTPLRVTFVKPSSRAEKAGIRPGDRLLKINGVDTSTLTIQEAHDMIVKSGIHLKLSVTSPDDFEDSVYYYEDPNVAEYDSEEERRIEEEKARKRRVHAKVSSYWSLQWPWVSRRKPIYRESNCFMVPSKYEEIHREKYPVRPSQRYFDDIILYDAGEIKKDAALKTSIQKQGKRTIIMNGGTTKNITNREKYTESEDSSDENTYEDSNNPTAEENTDNEEILSRPDNGTTLEDVTEDLNEDLNKVVNIEMTANANIDQEYLPQNDNEIENNKEASLEKSPGEESTANIDISTDDGVINEISGKSSDSLSRNEEDNILDSILSDDGQNLENSESMNER